ncbi:MAG TPA: translation elongation factor Ts [Anaerolineales bacterium]|jgi:elongation factor Ts|nr:translation elongation factor Ts [Anaerolineales bacterium]|tara:strand:- start:2643 stop:3236 length:594 start_codon:yes stop_codon:yes gene_type:complete
MGVSTSQVKELRVATGAPILDCKKALEHSKGDFDQAVDWLRKQGLSSVANKVGRDVSEGLIDSYIHPGNRVGVIVEVNCETDFVAKTDDFRALVHDILLHIAMANPLCIDKDDLPSESLSKEENLFREQALKEGKPENIVDKVVAGKIDKYYKQVCLLRQPFVKDEDQTIQDLINNAIAKFGENIVVHRFVRFELGQ